MNKLLIACFYFLSIGAACGQDDKSYLNYYRAVAIAEEAIVDGDYKEAIGQYQNIFEEYVYNNPIDCYIASQVASYAGDTSSGLSFLYKGLCFGLPVETINSNPHLAAIFKKADQSVIDSCRSIYHNGIDAKARATVISLAQRDQAFIHNLNLSPGGLYKPDGYTLKDNYRPFYDSLITEIISLTRMSGFPAQKVAGTQTGEDSLFRIGPNAVFALYPFIHHSNAWHRVAEMLWTELLGGNITPQMYGVIYENSSGKAPYATDTLYFASRPCQEKACKTLVKTKLKEINNARWEIGLGSYEVMEKKFLSRMKYYTWRKKLTKESKPFFDFECDLGFQGKQ